jgi:hypothetical protein
MTSLHLESIHHLSCTIGLKSVPLVGLFAFPARVALVDGMLSGFSDFGHTKLRKRPSSLNRGMLLNCPGAIVFSQPERLSPQVVQHLPSNNHFSFFCTRSEHPTDTTTLSCAHNVRAHTAILNRSPPHYKCLFASELTCVIDYGKNPKELSPIRY